MLDRLFTSGSRVSLLMALLFRRGETFHLRELARIAGVSPIYASKELANLEKLNLVKKEKKANLSLYSINDHSPIIPELRQIFLKTDYLGNRIAKELAGKADYCLIFGSFAQGEEGPDSDIDLFIVSDIKEDSLLPIIQKLEKESGREVNYVLWPKAEFDKRAVLGNALLKTIVQKKVVMLIGDEDGFRKRIR